MHKLAFKPCPITFAITKQSLSDYGMVHVIASLMPLNLANAVTADLEYTTVPFVHSYHTVAMNAILTHIGH